MTFKTIPMTAPEVAELMLDILVNDLGLKAGDAVPDHQLKEKYRTRNGDGADITVGLKYAEAQEWVAYDSVSDAWFLTEVGHASV